MSQSTTAHWLSDYSLLDIVGVVADAQTYRNLLYLLLAFPLGLAYFIYLVVGFSLGLGLAVLGVGIALLFGTVLGTRLIASFERWLANTLLGTTLPEPPAVDRSGGIIDTVKAYLRASSTWKGLGFVFTKFWLGTASFVLLVTFLGVAVELLVLPLFPGGLFNVQVGVVVADQFETTLQRALAVPAGAVLALVGLHLLNGFAGVCASVATALLGPERPAGDDSAASDHP